MPRIIRPDPVEEAEDAETITPETPVSFTPDDATVAHETDLYMAQTFEDSSDDYWKQEQRKREQKFEKLSADLDQPIDSSLLKQRKAFEGSAKVLTYVEWHTVVRRLNQFFGHDGWTTRVLKTTLAGEDHKSGVPLHVAAIIELTVRWPHGGTSTFTNVGTGENKGAVIYKGGRPVYDDDGQKARRFTWSGYDMAVKTAIHDGIKRCATALGDAFGLGLYDDDVTTSDDEATIVDTETTSSSTSAEKAPTPIRKPKADYPIATEDDVAECEQCGKEIKGYTSKTGRAYTTAQLVEYSQRDAGGHTFCYDCKQKYLKAKNA